MCIRDRIWIQLNDKLETKINIKLNFLTITACIKCRMKTEWVKHC